MTPTIAELAVSPEELDRAVEAMRVAPFAGTEGYHQGQVLDLCERLKSPCDPGLFREWVAELRIHLDALEDLKVMKVEAEKINTWVPV